MRQKLQIRLVDVYSIHEVRMKKKWENRFMDMAQLVASWSVDPSTKVGAVVVNSENKVLGVGFNGFPRCVNDDPAKYADRELKYKMVIHAETNAILNCALTPDGATIIVTHHPCSNCAGNIIQAGIREVICPVPEGDMAERFKESFELASGMFKEAGVKLTLI